MRLACFVFAVVLGIVPEAMAAVLPAGFVDDVLPWAFDAPTKLAFLPDGRLLVCEKGGIVYLVDDTSRAAIWVREDEVLNTDERGLSSIAVDPGFAVNRRLYFLYTCDPDSNGIETDHFDAAYSRLTRYELPAGAGVVDYATRTVLIGTGWSDGFLSPSGGHNVADLEWGRDGTLLVGCGDGAHFETVDPGGLDPPQFEPGRSPLAEDIGAFRAQSLQSHNGKVLRVDPENGHGLPSNPFWNGSPVAKRSRVWAYGLRNPWRMARRSLTGSSDPALGDPGTFYVGDVGWSQWEEVDVVRTPGQNFGWPCHEGGRLQDDYGAADPASAGCETIGTLINPSEASEPLLFVHHTDPDESDPPGVTGSTMIGGVFYSGATYPPEWRGRYFFGDYSEGWIRAVRTDAADQRVAVDDFGSDFGGVVSFAAHPASGDLYCVTIWDGLVHHLRWTGTVGAAGGREPRLALSAARPNPSRGAVALELTLAAPARVAFDVLDAAGRRVWAAPASDRVAGRTALLWPGLDAAGSRARPGLYFARATVDGRAIVRRVALIR